ncbi:glutamate--cysteine ligase [Halobacteriaceae archaeon GCM10025711]
MATGSPENFTELGTVGIEEEFFVVDERGRPTAGSDELVYEGDPPELLSGRIDHELFKFVLETQTPKLDGPSEVRDTVHDVREALVEYAAEHGFQVAAAGLHPAAKWRELEHAEKPRYRAQLDRIQYPQHRNTTAGLHVHVGVDDPDKAVWIANEIRWYLPVILALSANSPYWNGFDTGLQSARAKVFENLPNTGMPAAFDDYDDFSSFERLMLESGSINDRGELWWDVRPHTGHGTVEVRTPDAQHDPEITVAFVEYVHAVVIDLAERYEDGEVGYCHRPELLDENKWRALRYGRDASFIRRGRTGEVSLDEVVDRECQRLGVSGLREVYDAESGADRQRRIRSESGLDGLSDALIL